MDKAKADYQEHVFATMASLRGDLPVELGATLVLTVLGTHHLAHPLNPDQTARKAAARAFESMLFEDLKGSEDLRHLARGVLAPYVATATPSLENLSGAAFELPPYRSAIAGGLVRRIAMAQRARRQAFADNAEEWQASGRTIADAVLSSEGSSRSGTPREQGSSEVLNAVIAHVARRFALQDSKSICDLFAGTGGTLVSVSNATGRPMQHYAQDVNLGALYLAAWRLALHGKSGSHLSRADALIETAFRDDNKQAKRFDLVVGTPPLGYDVTGNELVATLSSEARGRYPFGLSRTGDWLFPQAALASAHPNGLVVVTAPPSALSRSIGTEASIRASLISGDQVSAVILLPGGLLTTTPLQSAVLALQPKKPAHLHNKVLMADLSSFKAGELVAMLEGALALTTEKVMPHAAVVTNEQLLNQDASLLPTIYLPPPDIRSTLRTRDEATSAVRNAVKQIQNAGDELLRAFVNERL